MEYLLGTILVFGHLKAIFFRDGTEMLIITPDDDFLLLDWHRQVVTISDDWQRDWAEHEEYESTFEDDIAHIITSINECLHCLGYLDEIWFDYNNQLQNN